MAHGSGLSRHTAHTFVMSDDCTHTHTRTRTHLCVSVHSFELLCEIEINTAKCISFGSRIRVCGRLFLVPSAQRTLSASMGKCASIQTPSAPHCRFRSPRLVSSDATNLCDAFERTLRLRSSVGFHPVIRHCFGMSCQTTVSPVNRKCSTMSTGIQCDDQLLTTEQDSAFRQSG